MKINGKAYRTIWLADDGWSVEIIDQTRLPHAFVVIPLQVDGGRRARDPHHAGARRAADRRHGRLRPRLALRDGRLRRGPRSRPSHSWPSSARPPSTCAGRWRRCGAAVAQPAARERVAAAYARAAEICDEDVETCRAHRRARARAHPRHRRAQGAGRAGQRPHPLQRRLARQRRLGHGACADLPGARRRHPACMSGSTRRARATRARRSPPGSSAATACRTPSIVDNAGGHLMQHGLVDLVHRRHRPRDRRTATSPTRSAPT